METVAYATTIRSRHPLTSRQALLFGWLTVGILDGLDACLFWFFRVGATPIQIFQSVAAGLVGREAAKAGGLPISLLGLGIHFLVAFCAAGTFLFLSRKLPDLARRPVLWGVLYGLAVYCFMYYVVMPLSRIGMPKAPTLETLVPFINNISIHVFGVGLPSAYWAWRAAREDR